MTENSRVPRLFWLQPEDAALLDKAVCLASSISGGGSMEDDLIWIVRKWMHENAKVAAQKRIVADYNEGLRIIKDAFPASIHS